MHYVEKFYNIVIKKVEPNLKIRTKKVTYADAVRLKTNKISRNEKRENSSNETPICLIQYIILSY